MKADPQTPLKNHYENMIYTGPVFMGSESAELQVVYDTGSDWLTVESSTCRSCFGDNFDQSASSSWTQDSDAVIEEIEYLSGSIEGVTGSDKVCLSNGDNCVDSFNFFLVEENFIIPPQVDGILGMCAGGKVEDHENGPDLVQALFDNDVVSENTFSFFLADDVEDSYVDFGPARDTGMSDPADIVYLSLTDHFFWLSRLVAVNFGGVEELSFKFPEPVEVVYDTGSSLSIVPESIAKAFFQ